MVILFFCFKQKTAYEMRISDWSSDVCSSDLTLVFSCKEQHVLLFFAGNHSGFQGHGIVPDPVGWIGIAATWPDQDATTVIGPEGVSQPLPWINPRTFKYGACKPFKKFEVVPGDDRLRPCRVSRSEEHTSELQSLMRI